MGITDVADQLVAHPLLIDRTFDELPFHVKKIAITGVGFALHPALIVQPQNTVRQREKAVVIAHKLVHQGVGGRVDKGNPSTDGAGCRFVEVGEMAEMGSRCSQSIAHRSHPHHHKMDVAVSVGSDKAAVESEGYELGILTHQQLLSHGFILVDKGGLHASVSLLRQHVEEVGGRLATQE